MQFFTKFYVVYVSKKLTFAVCSGQTLTRIRMMTRVPTTKHLPQEVQPGASATLNFPKVSFATSNFPEDNLHRIQPSRGHPFHPGAAFSHSKIFPRSFPLQKSSSPSPKLSTTAQRNLRIPLYSTILPTFKTCNAPTLKRVIIHGNRFPTCNTN